jgi:hypothetical protein
MPSQLLKNEGIFFLAAKNFTYRGVDYVLGEEFPAEEANNIETLVRSRFVIPVIDEGTPKPRHWHTHIRTREQAMEYLNRSRVQLVMPDPPDSDEVVNLDVLTHPETTPEPTQETSTESGAGEDEVPHPAEAVHSEEYDPSYHTVVEVKAYLAEHPEERERILAMEEAGRARKGILEE